ncbi:MAG: putative glycosyltransferase [Dehalococcoidia bacterium]|nr:putative glycosyltransferase [Dehalococcoidia bacterium]
MDLSVVIVSYNTRELLRQCLSSLVGCLETTSYRLECEVFVVDNASRDGSPEMVTESFPQVKLLALNNNLGFSRANNMNCSVS